MSREEEPPSMRIPESSNYDEQAFLDESLPMIEHNRRPEFIGYLRKYEMTVDQARQFRIAFINGQAESFLATLEVIDTKPPRSKYTPKRKAA